MSVCHSQSKMEDGLANRLGNESIEKAAKRSTVNYLKTFLMWHNWSRVFVPLSKVMG